MWRRGRYWEWYTHKPRNTKDGRQAPITGRGKEWILSQSFWREYGPDDTLIFKHLASKTVKEYSSVA